jgi:ketosteroid isomerase-like protein
MPEESTTPDLVELVRGQAEAVNVGDLDALLRSYASDCVWEMEPGTLQGVAVIRAFSEEWFASFDEIELEPEEIVDVGNGVVFALIRQRGRPVGSSGHVQMRFVSVSEWAGGLVTRVTSYTESDIETARAAAERLAEERG